MKANQIKKVWNEGRPAVNVFLCIPSSFAAEVMASLGWDAVTVDMQHGVADYSDMASMYLITSERPAIGYHPCRPVLANLIEEIPLSLTGQNTFQRGPVDQPRKSIPRLTSNDYP